MKQLKSVRLYQYQSVELEGLKVYLREMNVTNVTDAIIFRAMLNFAIKNKTVLKEIISNQGFVKIEELLHR